MHQYSKLSPTRFLRFLRLLMGKQIFPLLFCTFLMGIVYILTLVPPLIIGKITNLVGEHDLGSNLNKIYFCCAMIGLVFVVEALIRAYAKPNLAKLGFCAAYEAKILAFDKLLSKSVTWHGNELSGNKIQRLTAGGVSLERLLDQLHSNVLSVVLTFLGVLASFAYFNLYYLIYALFFIICLWGIQLYFYKTEHALISAAKEASEQSAGEYNESASNISTIKALSVEKEISLKVNNREQRARDIQVEQKRISHRKYSYFKMYDAFAYSIFVALTANSVFQGQISTGAFITLIAYFRSLDTAVRNTIAFMDSFVENWITVERLTQIFFAEEIQTYGTLEFPENWEQITLRDVSYAYPSAAVGLDNLTLSIKRGERIGIIGTTGSGKSTLAKILIGNLSISKGLYKIGEQEFKKISNLERADKISIVPQDSELFNMSLEDNVKLMRTVTSETFCKALKVAELNAVVEKLKNGIKEIIGEKGARLSGGERQRLGIARAVCKKSDILILDEATSALDDRTQAKIYDNLKTEMAGSTLIVIAHRLNALKDLDRIICLENGRVVKDGRPQEVLGDFLESNQGLRV